MADTFTGPTVQLRTGRARAVWQGHPWVLSQSVRGIAGDATPGDVVRVIDHREQTLDFGLYSGATSLPVRMLGVGARWPRDWPPADLPDDFWRHRLASALRLRAAFGLPRAGVTDCFRLLNSEGDATPGFIVDVYGRTAVLHLTTAAAWTRREAMIDALRASLELDGIYAQCDSRAAAQEGFPDESGVVFGQVPEAVEVIESGVRYRLALGELQKTGHYLDQRDNRVRFGQLAAGRRVLDAYSFAGSFALHAARGGAERVVAIDSSQPALEAARANAEANALQGRIEWVQAKAEGWLREAAQADARFDLISLDPPKLAPSRKSLSAALRKYEALCGQALQVLADDGLLMVASCSSVLGADELRGAVSLACARAQRTARMLAITHQPPDHPWPAAMREGLYLTAVLFQA